MKVLHVISSIDPKTGGPANSLLGLAKAQVAAGCKVALLATYTSGFNPLISEQLTSSGVEVHLVGPARGVLNRHPDLAKTADRLVTLADVVHIHAVWEEIQHAVAYAAQKQRKRYVFEPCALLMNYGLLTRNKWAKRVLLAWRVRRDLLNASAIHYSTQYEKEQSLLLPGVPTIVEPIGIDLEQFNTLPPRNSFRSKYHLIGARPLIVFLGRLHPGKGLEHLIPAIARCENKDAIIAAVGPDSKDYRSVLEGMAGQLGMQHRVIFAGPLYGSEKIAALADADLFCLPSDSESFSIATIEALAAGTPVLLSDRVGVMHEVVAAGVGEAVSRDIESLSVALSRWLNNSTLRDQAAAKTRQFVRDNYDWTKIAGHWNNHYAALKINH